MRSEPSPKRLLIVDDMNDVRKLVREVAESLGWTVTEAADGLEMKGCYDSGNFDLIILDMIMPHMDGIESLHWLRAQNCVSPIIVMSGFSSSYVHNGSTFCNALNLNLAASIQKPLKVSELRKILSVDPNSGMPPQTET